MNSPGALWQLGLEFRSSDFETICLRPGLPRRRGGKESPCQCRRHRRHGFDPWVGKILWRRKWQPTLVFLPGKFHGQQSLAVYNPWGCKESDMTGWLRTHTHTRAHRHMHTCTHTHTRAHAHTFTLTHIHTLTHACTRTHTHAHTHTHTRLGTRASSSLPREPGQGTRCGSLVSTCSAF